ncbi:MAG: YybH family protein [Acidimicrobiales bacterium]|jgi:ketosteroid isomerase-like protein
MSPDAIAPASASSPAEALELLCEALSDGDVEAAASRYEPGAVVSVVAGDRRRHGALREALASLAGMKLAVEATCLGTVVAGDTALVLVYRSVSGLPGEAKTACAGQGAATLRRQPSGAWLIVADRWGLNGPLAANFPPAPSQALKQGRPAPPQGAEGGKSP